MINYEACELPTEWKWDRLENVAKFHDEKRIPVKESERATTNRTFPYYGASGIIDYVDDYIFDGDFILLGEDGANIISRTQPLAFRVSGKIWVNNHAHVLQPTDDMDIGYLTEFLESLSYEKYNTGTAQPKLPQSVCRKIEVIVPSLAEQRKIAAILGTWDAAIATVEQLIATLQARKQGLMQRLLTGEVRFLEFAGSEWKLDTLENVATFHDEKRIPVKESERATINRIYPYYGASGIIDYVDDYIFDGDFILLGEDGANIISRTQQLAFRVSGKIWVNNHAHVIQPNEDMDISFLTEYLESLSYIKYNTGTAQPKLPQSVCRKIEVVIPSLAEQRKIGAVSGTVDAEIQLLHRECGLLKEQKQALMQQLLTGQVRVQTAEAA